MNILERQEAFIVEATRVHGKRYDYSDVEYVNMKHKVSIKCQQHNIKLIRIPYTEIDNINTLLEEIIHVST